MTLAPHWPPECNPSGVPFPCFRMLTILEGLGAVSKQPSVLHRSSPWKSVYTREINSPQTLALPGKQAMSAWLGNLLGGIGDSFCLERVWASLQSKAIWLGPSLQQDQARALRPGVQELPVIWQLVSARRKVLASLSTKDRFYLSVQDPH